MSHKICSGGIRRGNNVAGPLAAAMRWPISKNLRTTNMRAYPMGNSEIIELKAEHVTYFSDYDEAAFFEWIKRIKCFINFGGHGYGLSIFVDKDVVDQDDLRELLALFHRYNIDKKQLSALSKPSFDAWFRNDGTYWHTDVFGGDI